MRLRDIFRFPFEVLGVCIAGLVIPVLPRSWVVGLARVLGDAGYRFSRRDKKIALANLDTAFGDTMSPEAKEKIARESFQNFTQVLLDYFWFSVFSRRRVARHVVFDSSYDYAFRTLPLIFLTAHFGNWEVLGLACTMRCGGLLSVAAKMENPLVDFILRMARSGTGQRIVGREGALRSLVRELKQGGRVAMVMDQNVLPEDGGEFVSLFGLPAPVSRAAALLQSHTGADVAFAYCLPDDRGGYTAYAMPPHRRGTGKEADATQVFAGMLEEVVRKNPGKWLWAYKRWKFIPEGCPRDKFPFYSRGAESDVAKASSRDNNQMTSNRDERGK